MCFSYCPKSKPALAIIIIPKAIDKPSKKLYCFDFNKFLTSIAFKLNTAISAVIT